MTALRLFGGGTRASVIVDFVRWRLADRFELQGFYDDNPSAGGALGIPRLGDVADGLRDMNGGDGAAVLALGTYASWRACELLHELRRRRVPVASLVSPMASISPSAEIGPGALILDGVFIGARARIGALLTANALAIIEHDTTLGHNVMLGSGAAIAGFAHIEDHCFIGTNATVLPKVVVGSGTLLAAGSTASRDLPAGVIAVGAPAKTQRSVGEGDEVPTSARISVLPRP
ncbi:acetyltransferase [Dongia sedimenti]|uniref:Acetyltransferase n=1 Tax=Dongia sedimenti TaxID=3064282 RepID=A0ABU0YKX2_9PROT|nr:acetyltransferase [Rhodospirillaceae bacterium R-7]